MYFGIRPLLPCPVRPRSRRPARGSPQATLRPAAAALQSTRSVRGAPGRTPNAVAHRGFDATADHDPDGARTNGRPTVRSSVVGAVRKRTTESHSECAADSVLMGSGV